MQTILITGGTGMIGKALSSALVKAGYRIIILSRNKQASSSSGNIEFAYWNPDQQEIDMNAIQKADAIIHLAGANVADGRWTEKRKKEIVDSRVNSGALLIDALQKGPNRVRTLVSASAIGYYGHDNVSHTPFREADPPHHDFLGETVIKWEASVKPVIDMGIRLVQFRIGIVLSNEGGAYPEFKKTLPFGVASILGSGKQMVSWIHIDDLVRMFLEAINNEHMAGVYNAVAPQPVSNETLMKAIVHVKGQTRVFARVPEFVLKAMLGEMSVEVLKSATVSAEKILSEGFQFHHPDIKSAIRKLEGDSNR